MGSLRATGLCGGRLAVLVGAFWLAATLVFGRSAMAEEPATTCAVPVGRLVALQGAVELQRAGSPAWLAVKQLDTPLCSGDRLRTDAHSRAALFVQPETLVRVDQNTAIRVNQSTDEIEVEFFAAELVGQAQAARGGGAAYFISRFPRKFKVKTPHMNAAVEGTEFMVESSGDATKLTVLEGKVASQSVATAGTRLVEAGRSVQTGVGGDGAIAAVVKPQDAVQWVLRYPPISDEAGSAGLTDAERLLRAGSVDEALAVIDATLTSDPESSDAHALRSVIQVAKNDKVSALASARRATELGVSNYRAWLALSYAQQADFDLEAALESARRAEQLKSDSALAHARVAELLLSLGDTRRAEAAARAAVASGPEESRAYSVLGFVHLAKIETKAARTAFQEAIVRDSFSALPRLGLGLAMIRDGELKAGREQIEIAVALDPSNSLLRSYVGKAYYEENTKARDGLAAVQFELARALDPNDPTPWFYDALLHDASSRPATALEYLGASTARNGGRAVYRSRQLLDQDLAARGASQAVVYNELGFHQLGLNEAAQSLAVDPASSSAHRFLADINSTLPRYGIARASELLQAQLRQPLGAPPLQPQLANDVLFQNTFFGAATVGLNDFNPLFIRDGVKTQVFGLVGDDDTWGEQVILNALNGPVNFSVSQFATDTDGYRPNNDDSIRQYDGFLQWQASDSTSLQFEVTDWSRDSGDLTSSFDPAFFSDVLRNSEDVETQRLGFRQVIDATSDLLVSVIHQDRHTELDFPDPDFPATFIDDQDSVKAEIQYLTARNNLNFLIGAGYFDGNSSSVLIAPPDEFPSNFKPSHFNTYAYLLYAPRANFPQWQLGLSYDELQSDVGNQSEVNPKFGVIWKIREDITLRAAAFRFLKRRINSDQGLEPSQLAGFNQLFDDRNGTVSEAFGIALDYAPAPSASAGLQVSRRDASVPTFDEFNEVVFQQQRENSVSGYAYWLPSPSIALSVEPRHQDFRHGSTFTRLEMTEIPLELKYIRPSGLWFALTATGVRQRGEFTGPGGTNADGSDRFWLLDGMIAYRLPGRKGTISLHGTNLTNEKFQFQEVDLGVPPRYVPEARVLLRLSLNF